MKATMQNLVCHCFPDKKLFFHDASDKNRDWEYNLSNGRPLPKAVDPYMFILEIEWVIVVSNNVHLFIKNLPDA